MATVATTVSSVVQCSVESSPCDNYLDTPTSTTTCSNSDGQLDEFEEFRARANSGGLSPEMRRALGMRKANIEAARKEAKVKASRHHQLQQQEEEEVVTRVVADSDDGGNESDNSIDRYFPENPDATAINRDLLQPHTETASGWK
jgi:hypothetical protein